jgi:hypothetical protein
VILLGGTTSDIHSAAATATATNNNNNNQFSNSKAVILHFNPYPIQFFCHPHTPQLLFILGVKETGGLLVIILQF